jgi:hypothetical protein
MVRWITCQEKIHAFSAYLQWHIPYMRELDPGTGEADLADEIENGGVSKDLEVELEEDIMNPGHTYHIAKYPGYPNTTISTIISEFQATDFIHTLNICAPGSAKCALSNLRNNMPGPVQAGNI